MRIRTGVFLGHLSVVSVGLALLLFWAARDLGPQYRKATEEPLVDASRILAGLAAEGVRAGRVDVEAFRRAFGEIRKQSFSARIFDFTKVDVDMRVYITDATGLVLYDSYKPENEGQDYSRWNDVSRTLAGQYGARATRDLPGDPRSEVMYIASPIIYEGRTVGVLSVGKPVRAASQFIADTRRYLVLGLVLVFGALLVAGALVSHRVASPILVLAAYARSVRDGRKAPLPPQSEGEVGELAAAFEEMREALEGRKYVEHYVQGLTHEIKGPLSAIGGAVELMAEEDMPPERRAAFMNNIRGETERLRAIVDRLLLLSSLEVKSEVGSKTALSLHDMAREVLAELSPLAQQRAISFDLEGQEKAEVEGDVFLVKQALLNLVQNAVEFSPEGGRVAVRLDALSEGYLTVQVRDQGPGIPPYALEKVFDRFYSLKRPATGRKSSGLGLTLVREIALLHGGRASLENLPQGGALATLALPASAR